MVAVWLVRRTRSRMTAVRLRLTAKLPLSINGAELLALAQALSHVSLLPCEDGE